MNTIGWLCGFAALALLLLWVFTRPTKQKFGEDAVTDLPPDLDNVPDVPTEAARQAALQHVLDIQNAVEVERLEREHKALADALPPKVVHVAKHVVKHVEKKKKRTIR